MNIKKILNKHKLIFTSLLSLILLFSISTLAKNYIIPDKINIIKNQKNTLSLNLPFTAKIESADVFSNQSEDSINLKDSFTVKSNDDLEMKLSLFGILPVKTVSLNVLEDTKLIPCGLTVGVKVNTEGILVLGTGQVNTEDGNAEKPCQNEIKSADVIKSVNGILIQDKNELMDAIENSNGKELEIVILRESEEKMIKIKPVKSANEGKYKLGLWVRDSTQGIGTITYINPESKKFAALGHGILDIDTKQLMGIKDGNIMDSNINSVKKGKKGSPGELVGDIYQDSVFGDIEENTAMGVYGNIYDEDFEAKYGEALDIGLKQDIIEGPATIRSNVLGQEVKDYDIIIEKINQNSQDNTKGMVIKIVDQDLLDITNGIVQGMSGSPIIQNNKIIGAVTHVFVQEPSKGYGIFIESMLKQESTAKNNKSNDSIFTDKKIKNNEI